MTKILWFSAVLVLVGLANPHSLISQRGPIRPGANLLLIQSGTIGVDGRLVYQLTRVGTETPAQKAGLEKNDIVLSVDKRRTSEYVIRDTIKSSIDRPGRTFEITYARLNSGTQKWEISTVSVTSE